jgi:hypothetical protein
VLGGLLAEQEGPAPGAAEPEVLVRCVVRCVSVICSALLVTLCCKLIFLLFICELETFIDQHSYKLHDLIFLLILVVIHN